jgi:hypothetical protein
MKTAQRGDLCEIGSDIRAFFGPRGCVQGRHAGEPGRLEIGVEAGGSEPVHGGGAEVGEVVLYPQSAVPGEAVTMAGPAGELRVAPGLVGDAGQARQQQEGQVVEARDGLGPDGSFDSRDLRCAAVPERFGGFPVKDSATVWGA